MILDKKIPLTKGGINYQSKRNRTGMQHVRALTTHCKKIHLKPNYSIF